MDDVFEQLPGLKTFQPFTQMASQTHWFRAIGETPDPLVVTLAEDYAAALGFPECRPYFIREWQEAADAFVTADMNSPAWEAEEQLRVGLAAELSDAIGEDMLMMLMSSLGEQIAPSLEQAAIEASEYLRIDDEEFLRSAIGAGVQVCHQAAMVAMTEAGDDHPFALRFSLFEKGHWPIGIFGGSFLLL